MAGGIDVDLDLAALLRLADLVDLGQRDGVVLLAEMHDDRAFRTLGRDRADTAAVIGRGGGEAVEPRRGHPGEKAAPAIADDAESAGGLDRVARGGDVTQRRV